MKVAFFSWEFPPNIVGGLGVYACNMSRTLSKMGHNVNVFTVNDGSLKIEDAMGGIRVARPFIKTPAGMFSPLLSDSWNRWIGGDGFIAAVLTHNILAAAKFIESQSNGGKYDLIVCHDWLSGLAGEMIKENTGLPFIFQLHSTEWGRSQNCPFKPIADLERQAAESADMIITVSNPMQEHLVCLGYPASKIRVAWNGIDPAKYSPKGENRKESLAVRQKYGIKPDERMILYIGRLASEKGALELVQAMSLKAKR
jgi:glycosyltransferase involved in cell wall biosynthesis